MLIGFLKADGFNFYSSQQQDDSIIKKAKEKAQKLFRKVRLARVKFSEEIVGARIKSENTMSEDPSLFKQLLSKEKERVKELIQDSLNL
jgi:type II secretory pathway component PulC